MRARARARASERNTRALTPVPPSRQLAIRALLEVVESGAKSIEVGVMRHGRPMEMVDQAKLEEIVAQIAAEKEAEASAAGAGAGR